MFFVINMKATILNYYDNTCVKKSFLVGEKKMTSFSFIWFDFSLKTKRFLSGKECIKRWKKEQFLFSRIFDVYDVQKDEHILCILC